MIVMTGATGFVGGNLVKRLVEEGLKVRCIIRSESGASSLQGLGVEIAYGDVRDKGSLIDAVKGADIAVSLVGILAETRKATFKAIHVDGVRNYLEACKEEDVKDFIHISALGTRENARSRYHQTKWEAEELIRGSSLNYAIFRPSVIFGREDNFVNLFARVIRLSPVINIPGTGKNRMQPVYVKDLVDAMTIAIKDRKYRGETYEIGGADTLTFDEIIDTICRVMGKKRLKLHMPMALLKPGAFLMETLLPNPILTRDQLLMLQEDNITDNNALKEVFNIEPTNFEEGIRSYLQ